MSTVSSPARVEVPKGIAKWLLLSIAFVLSVLTSRATEAVIPQLNHSYYIAAQTWDGKQYVERVLTNVSAGNVLQSLEITDAARWMVTGADAEGAVTLLSPVGKRLMTGGISSSTNVRNLVSVPAQWTLEDHPEGAVVILCKYNNKYIVARNDGAAMNGEYTSYLTSYNPKRDAYTQYFKFYDASQSYLTVSPNYGGTGAVFEFVPDDGEPNGGQPLRGNIWEMEAGTLSVVPGSYDDSKFAFKGFRVNGGELQQSVHTAHLSATTNVHAVFEYLIFCDTYGDNADKWLHIAANANQGYHLQYLSDDVLRSQVAANRADQEWCLVGTDEGFVIYNRAVGPDKVLTATGTANNSLVKMADYTEGNPMQIWMLSSTPTSLSIALKSAPTVGLNQAGGNGGQIKVYTGTDANSRWHLRKRSMGTAYADRDGNVIEDGALYTFLSANPGFYTRQKVMKAVFLNGADGKLYWKTYDPADDTFYFKAHVDYGIVTMECVSKPGFYLTGAATAVAEQGNQFSVNRWSGGDCNIFVNGGNSFHANNHGGGGGGSSNIINYSGGSGGPSAWYVQRADNKKAEAERYAGELAAHQAAIDEANRLAARDQLKGAIDQVFVGTSLGQTTYDAWAAANDAYNNLTLSLTDYNEARTALLAALNVPVIGSYYIIKSEGTWADGNERAMQVGRSNVMRWEQAKPSLYQIWMVTDRDEAVPTQMSFLNIGSNTFLKAQYNDGNSATTTSNAKSYVNLKGAGDGIFYIQSLTASNGHTTLSAGQADNGNATEGNVCLHNTQYNVWRIVEISEAEMSIISNGEDARQNAREELRRAIADVRSALTTTGAIGYYNNLDAAIDAAVIVYNDETNLASEYADAKEALDLAFRQATPVQPRTDVQYVVSLADGTHSLQVVGDGTEAHLDLGTYDDTLPNQLLAIAHRRDNVYTLSNGDVSQDIVLTPAGKDMYRIEGYDGLFAIRVGTMAVNHDYIEGGIYRVINTETGQALANNNILVARTTMADIDDTCTDHTQLWTIEKMSGADRYSLRNYGTGRYLDQTAAEGATVPTSPGISPWRLQAGDDNDQYMLVTTEGLCDQYIMSGADVQPLMSTAQGTALQWRFEPAVPVIPEEPEYKVYTFKCVNKSTYMCAVGTTAEQRRYDDLPAEADRSRWALIPYDFTLADGTVQTRYGIRNYFSGLYIQNVTANQGVVSAGVTPVYFELVNRDLNGQKRYAFKSPTNVMYLNAHGANNTIIGYNQADNGSTWIVTEVEGLITTEREMMEKADAYEGYIAPSNDLKCNIVNHSVGSYIDEDYRSMAATAAGANAARKSQMWRLHYDDEEAMYVIENLQTGDFVMSQTTATNGRAFAMTSDPERAGHFTIATNPAFVGQRIYNIIDGVSGKAVVQNGSTLVTGDPGPTAEPTPAEWRFRKVDISDEEIALMRKKFDEQKHMTEHVEEYRVIFSRIFADNACTIVNPDITDEQWEAEMAKLPEMLSNMCRKIKDNTWPLSANGRSWEKAFRIVDYAVTSNTGFASAWWKLGYGMSQLNDPCGITAKAGDVLAIMLDRKPSDDAQLALQLVQGFNIRANESVALQPGLNMVQVNNDCNVFVAYLIKSSNDNPRYYLDKFPDIKIHIEGGTVIGQLDRTRDLVVERAAAEGETPTPYTYATTTREGANELWHDMLEDGLVRNAYMSQIKSRNIYFHFNSNSVVNACPVNIGEVTDIWDWIIDCEWWLMGINARPDAMHVGTAPGFINDYTPNLDKRFNGRWIAAERSGGYMNAQPGGGAQYTTSTIGTIMNFNNMRNGDAHWGPAHEHGHCHQSPINMCGMKETSNNLYSNVVTWEFGRQMSRGESMPRISAVYGLGGHWYDLGIWACTQMYYKLFLYYHVAGHKPTFYQEVHDRLRKEPFSGRSDSANPISRDYLHFALICSEVAGEDLSDFFEAYGMFRDVTPENSLPGAVFEEKVDPTNGKTYNCRKYADYSTYFMYSTPEMIAEYKAKIKACGPKNTSIIFIDDRFASPMHNEWADEGRMRGPRDNSAGSQGNMGNVADFTPEAIANGAAPVGYKVYDEEGNLLYYTATVNADGQPVIPANVMARIAELAGGEDKLVVAEVSSNHDVVEVADENDHIYTLTHYAYDKHGNRREPHTVTSPGRLKPVLGPNEMVVVGKRTESVEPRIMYSRNAKAAAQRLADEIPDYKFADQHNVIIDNDGYLTMASLDITDGKPIYLPANDLGPVTADHVTYTRNNIQEWNSVCLPFALSADDLPQGSKIYIVGGYDSSTITLFKVSNVEAGRPCFVYCPAGTDKWNIDIDLCDAVTTDVAVSNPMGLHLEGTFEKTVAPQGSYAIDADGDGFNKNETDTEVAPMRSYVAAGNARTNASNLALVVVDDTSGAQPVVVDEVPMQHDVMYDLLGRPLKMPKRGQPYILNGRVVVDR